MKKFAKKFLGIAVAAALLVGSVMPTVAVMAADHQHHKDDTQNDISTDGYTITLTTPEGYIVNEDNYDKKKFGAYQIFSGKVKGEKYTEPGASNDLIPITDIKWGNAFEPKDEVPPLDTEAKNKKTKENIIRFVFALAEAQGGNYKYAFSDFDGFGDGKFVTAEGKLNADFLTDEDEEIKVAVGADNAINKESIVTGELTKVNFDKLAVAVADVIAVHKDHEWLQAFVDILGGYGTEYKQGNFVNRYYGGNKEETYAGWKKSSTDVTNFDQYEIKVPAGYYMIMDLSDIDDSPTTDDSDAYSARMLFVANDIQQKLKEDVPELDKKILRNTEAVATDGHETDVAGVGDVVHFQLKGTLPSNYDLYLGGYQYTFEDTLSDGLDLVKYEDSHGVAGSSADDCIKVTVKGLFKWDNAANQWKWDASTTAKGIKLSTTVYTHPASGSGSDPSDEHLKGDVNNYSAKYVGRKLTVEFPCLKEIRIDGATAGLSDGVYRLGYNSADASSEIYVDYYAKVNKDAVVKNANENKAQIKYSDNPQAYSDTDYTTIDEAKVYTFGLDIVKVNAAEFLKNDGNLEGAGVKLAGAEFVLVRKDPSNSKNYQIAKFSHVEASKEAADPFAGAAYESIDSWEGFDVTKKADKPTPEELQTAIDTYLATAGEGYKVTSDENGAINISGLDAGVTYTMVETKTPSDEYAKIDPFDITLTAEMSGDEYTGKLDNATSDEEVGEGESFSLKKYVDIIDPEKVGSAATQKADDNGSANMLVANFKYVDLPSTGGIGIYPFYIIGGIGIAASAVLFALSKRKKTA